MGFEPQKHVEFGQKRKAVNVTKRYGEGSENLGRKITEKLGKRKEGKDQTLFRTVRVKMSPSPLGLAFLAAVSSCKKWGPTQR